MSRAYQVRVCESLTHHSRVEDGIECQLELLGVLGQDRMSEILGQHLTDQGYEIDDNGKASKTFELPDGSGPVTITIDTKTGKVKVSSTAESTVELDTEVVDNTYEEYVEESTKRATARAKSQLQEKANQIDEAARQKVTERLDGALAHIKPELDKLTDAVTKAALKERAAQMGEVMEVSENADGEMTIRVRV